MDHLPFYIPVVFVLSCLLTLFLFYKAIPHKKSFLFIISIWLVLQAVISLGGFYTDTSSIPPRFVFAIGPPLLAILLLFILPQGRMYLDKLDLRYLTLLHIVRIPVELVLFWLALQKTVPELMTFAGRNWDIFSGLSALFIYYVGFVKNRLPRKALLLWNFLCLALLINIVSIAILSAPFPFQKFAFDQPNIAVLYFPYVWLPCFIVPLVLLSHLVAFRQLLKRTD